MRPSKSHPAHEKTGFTPVFVFLASSADVESASSYVF
jgi:hypothetical protein